VTWSWSPYESNVRPRPSRPGESVFFTRQLEYIRPGLFDVPYPELKSRALIPIEASYEYKPKPRSWFRRLRGRFFRRYR
jgi:hypothetical protein